MTSICILTSAHSPFDTRIFHKQAKSLSAAGYNVSLVAPHTEDETVDDIEIKAVKAADSHKDRLFNLPRMYSQAKRLDPDVFHFHDPGLLPVGSALATRTDTPVIYDCHENYANVFQFYDFPPDVLNPLTRRGVPIVESRLAAHCDGIITATGWLSENMRQRGHSNVATVRNFPKVDGIDFSLVDVDRSHEYQLVYVGGLTQVRGVFQMVKLLNELRKAGLDVGLWLLGTYDSNMVREKVLSYINSNGLSSHVRHFGRVKYEHIFSYLSAADLGLVLLQPDWYNNGIATKIFEYLYSEIPVVANDTTANRRYVSEDVGRVVSWKNTIGQADAVKELLLSPETRVKMGENGRKRVEEEYSWSNEKIRLLDFYDEILN